MAYQAIRYEVRDHVAWVTLNRPEVLNARNSTLIREMMDACEQVTRDPDVRVMVLAGAGRAFCAGRDLKEHSATADERTPVESRRSRLGGSIDHVALAGMDKPTIAAVHGYALGGGCELACCCDIRIAADNVRIGLMEVRRGLMGGNMRLARIVGKPWALYLSMTGEPADAETALRIGLVHRVVPLEQLMEETERAARLIMENSPIAVRYVKEAIVKGAEVPYEYALRLEEDLAALLSTTADAHEGPRAFAEKRLPRWLGR